MSTALLFILSPCRRILYSVYALQFYMFICVCLSPSFGQTSSESALLFLSFCFYTCLFSVYLFLSFCLCCFVSASLSLYRSVSVSVDFIVVLSPAICPCRSAILLYFSSLSIYCKVLQSIYKCPYMSPGKNYICILVSMLCELFRSCCCRRTRTCWRDPLPSDLDAF